MEILKLKDMQCFFEISFALLRRFYSRTKEQNMLPTAFNIIVGFPIRKT